MVIRPTQASVVDYLNLGEVELFDMAGQKLAPASLVFTLGSTLDSYRSSNCNDGNPFTMCHTLLTTPTLAITYPCAGPTSVSKVIVTNRVDCCKDRIVKFTMDFLDATGKADRPSYQFPTTGPSYTVTVQGAGAVTAPIENARIKSVTALGNCDPPTSDLQLFNALRSPVARKLQRGHPPHPGQRGRLPQPGRGGAV